MIRVTRDPEIFIHELETGDWQVVDSKGKKLAVMLTRESATGFAINKARGHLKKQRSLNDSYRMIDLQNNRLLRQMMIGAQE